MKKNFLLLSICAVFAVIFYPTFLWLFERFFEEDSYYSHGFLIPLVTLFLIWGKKMELKTAPVEPAPIGLAITVFGLFLQVVSWGIFKIGFISGISCVITLFGIVLYVNGYRKTRIILFPLLFLLLMLPAPKVFLIGLTFNMKMLAASLAVKTASLMNFTVERAGSMIYLPNGVLTVDNECSGINSLISIFTLSLIFGYITEKSILKRLLFVLVSLPVALFANICRVIFLMLAAYIYGIKAASIGILHYGAGMVLWAVALLALITIWRGFRWKEQN
jgi:exosortase